MFIYIIIVSNYGKGTCLLAVNFIMRALIVCAACAACLFANTFCTLKVHFSYFINACELPYDQSQHEYILNLLLTVYIIITVNIVMHERAIRTSGAFFPVPKL